MNSDQVALHDSNVIPQGPSHAEGLEVNTMVQPPLGTESHVRFSKSKSSFRKASSKNDSKTERSGPIAQSLDLLQSKSPQCAGPCQDKGRGYSIDRSPGQDPNDLLSPEGASRAGKSIHSAQVEPTVMHDGPEVQSNLRKSYSSNEVRHALPSGGLNETHATRTVGCAMALTQDT